MGDKGEGLRNSQYWRERAEEARARAGEMQDRDAATMLRNIARMYDEMAERAAKREGRGK